LEPEPALAPSTVQAMVEASASPSGVRHGGSNGGVPEAGLSDYADQMRDFLEQHASGRLGSLTQAGTYTLAAPIQVRRASDVLPRR